MVIQCNPFVATPPIFEIVGDPSPNPPPLVDAPAWVRIRTLRTLYVYATGIRRLLFFEGYVGPTYVTYSILAYIRKQ